MKIFYCTICKKVEETYTVCKRIYPYVDDIIIIHQYPYKNELSKVKPDKCHLYLTEWKDDFSWYRNQYIKRTGEIIVEKGYDINDVWMLITDCDEIPSLATLYNLKDIIHHANNMYSGKGATLITINSHDVIVKGGESSVNNSVTDNNVIHNVRLLEDYNDSEILYNHVSDSYKEMLMKYNNKLRYDGIVHHMIHGTGLKFMQAPKEYYYDHIKTETDINIRGCRNYFIGGGGVNEKTEKWKMLRKICDKYGILTWEQMKNVMDNGHIEDELLLFFINHKDDHDSHIDSELRSFYTYYDNIHHDEIIYPGL